MEQNNLAKNLSALRRTMELSQEKAAEAVGVTRQALAKWESGETTPDVLHCDRLAELYGVSLDDLLHYEQKRLPPAAARQARFWRGADGRAGADRHSQAGQGAF